MRTLGLDLGTNSIGWAVLETQGRKVALLDKGVYLFPKGVGEEKKEYSLAAERTTYRASRRLKMRRRWRKQATLATLMKHDLCPGLTEEALGEWKQKRYQYPGNETFRQWLNTKAVTKDGKPAGPYYCRWRAATEQLDLEKPEDRYCLGRAFYHLAQRRGYKSNRISGEEKDGAVHGEIAKLDEKRHGRTLGQYFYEECLGKEPVRGSGHYTSRPQYEEEFRTICEKQALKPELVNELGKNIFMQRPLRSQKGTVGKCIYEPSKARASDSHPLTERFRLLQIVNNIRVADPGSTDMRPLNDTERKQAISWLETQSRIITFDKLAKKLVPRNMKPVCGQNKYSDEADTKCWRFNYRGDSGLPASPFTARMIKLFGADWRAALHSCYRKAGNKSIEQVVDDVWHVIFSFDDAEKLKAFGIEQLGLDQEQAKEFANPLPIGYGSLSLAAMRRILPFLEKGLIYSHSVFLAKLPDLLAAKGIEWAGEESSLTYSIRELLDTHTQAAWSEKAANSLISKFREDHVDPSSFLMTEATRLRFRDQVEDAIKEEAGGARWNEVTPVLRAELLDRAMTDIVHWTGQRDGFMPVKRLDERVKCLLAERYKLDEKVLDALYHPSEVEAYRSATRNNEGILQLGSPRIDSIRNPVFMRAMFQLRRLINSMLKEGLIDGETRIRIEMARDLNTFNMRAAIERDQREHQKERDRIHTEIAGLPCAPSVISDRDVLKYMLWEEQDRKCLYTGVTIEISAFLGDNPAYDIEHTIPRSRRLDNSQSNLTLCDRHFNRTIKRNRLPAELPQAEEIQQRVGLLWDDKIEELQKLVEKRRASSRSAADKATKDTIRQSLHYEQIRLRHYKAKRDSFFRADAPEGFTNSQLVDTRLICKYAMQYLKTAFPKVYSIKAGAVSAVKEIWGLDDKNRGDHAHHAIDAIVTACMNPGWYSELAEFYHQYERYLFNEAGRPATPQPWPGFDRDLNENVAKNILVVHYSPDNLFKQTRKVVRLRGKIVKDSGTPLYAQGDSVRGALHQDTIYAKIQDPAEQKNGETGSLKAVVRRLLDKTFKDFDKIVDPQIRQKVMDQKEALKAGEQVWFDQEQQIPIKKVRCYATNNKAENLITLNAHRDKSRQAHKQHRYAANDGNYITALYRGEINGKAKADWKVINNFEAVQAAKRKSWESIIPQTDENGLSIRHLLKKNTLVLFKQSSDEDLKKFNQEELSRRLFRITVMEGNRIKAIHHRCGLAVGDIPSWPSKIDFVAQTPSASVYLSVNGIHIAVEGDEFRLNPMGHIHWLEAGDDA